MDDSWEEAKRRVAAAKKLSEETKQAVFVDWFRPFLGFRYWNFFGRFGREGRRKSDWSLFARSMPGPYFSFGTHIDYGNKHYAFYFGWLLLTLKKDMPRIEGTCAKWTPNRFIRVDSMNGPWFSFGFDFGAERAWMRHKPFFRYPELCLHIGKKMIRLKIRNIQD